MKEEDFVTFKEYKLMCYNDRIIPENRKDDIFVPKTTVCGTGKILLSKHELEELKNVFEFLSDKKEVIKKKNIEKFVKKIGVNLTNIELLFELIEEDEISFDLFVYIFKLVLFK